MGTEGNELSRDSYLCETKTTVTPAQEKYEVCEL